MEAKNKITIEKVDKDYISLIVDGKKQRIPNTPDALKELLNKEGQSNLQVGEKIYNIGEISEANFTTTINQQFSESKTSKKLKLFLYVLVPVLSISVAVFYNLYQKMQQPGLLTVELNDTTPNSQLSKEKSMVLLHYGNKIDTVTTMNEATFKEIPATFKGESLRMSFISKGYVSIDTTFVFNESNIVLPIKRDDSFSKLYGYVKSENGQALQGVKLMVLDLVAQSDVSGKFSFNIPFDQQNTEHRIMAQLEGCQDWNITTPVFENVPIEIVMQRFNN